MTIRRFIQNMIFISALGHSYLSFAQKVRELGAESGAVTITNRNFVLPAEAAGKPDTPPAEKLDSPIEVVRDEDKNALPLVYEIRSEKDHSSKADLKSLDVKIHVGEKSTSTTLAFEISNPTAETLPLKLVIGKSSKDQFIATQSVTYIAPDKTRYVVETTVDKIEVVDKMLVDSQASSQSLATGAKSSALCHEIDIDKLGAKWAVEITVTLSQKTRSVPMMVSQGEDPRNEMFFAGKFPIHNFDSIPRKISLQIEKDEQLDHHVISDKALDFEITKSKSPVYVLTESLLNGSTALFSERHRSFLLKDHLMLFSLTKKSLESAEGVAGHKSYLLPESTTIKDVSLDVSSIKPKPIKAQAVTALMLDASYSTSWAPDGFLKTTDGLKNFADAFLAQHEKSDQLFTYIFDTVVTGTAHGSERAGVLVNSEYRPRGGTLFNPPLESFKKTILDLKRRSATKIIPTIVFCTDGSSWNKDHVATLQELKEEFGEDLNIICVGVSSFLNKYMVQEMVDIVGGATILSDYASVDDAQTVMGLIKKHKTTQSFASSLRIENAEFISYTSKSNLKNHFEVEGSEDEIRFNSVAPDKYRFILKQKLFYKPVQMFYNDELVYDSSSDETTELTSEARTSLMEATDSLYSDAVKYPENLLEERKKDLLVEISKGVGLVGSFTALGGQLDLPEGIHIAAVSRERSLLKESGFKSLENISQLKTRNYRISGSWDDDSGAALSAGLSSMGVGGHFHDGDDAFFEPNYSGWRSLSAAAAPVYRSLSDMGGAGAASSPYSAPPKHLMDTKGIKFSTISHGKTWDLDHINGVIGAISLQKDKGDDHPSLIASFQVARLPIRRLVDSFDFLSYFEISRSKQEYKKLMPSVLKDFEIIDESYLDSREGFSIVSKILCLCAEKRLPELQMTKMCIQTTLAQKSVDQKEGADTDYSQDLYVATHLFAQMKIAEVDADRLAFESKRRKLPSAKVADDAKAGGAEAATALAHEDKRQRVGDDQKEVLKSNDSYAYQRILTIVSWAIDKNLCARDS